MTNTKAAADGVTVVLECGYCRVRTVTLTGEDAADWLEASDERKPSQICSTCAETCRAHAKIARAEREWVAEGSAR